MASILQSRCCEALSSLDQFPIADCHCDRVMHRQKKDRTDWIVPVFELTHCRSRLARVLFFFLRFSFFLGA